MAFVHAGRKRNMKRSTIARILGGAVLLALLTVAGALNITSPWLLVVTIGFAWGYESLVVLRLKRAEDQDH